MIISLTQKQGLICCCFNLITLPAFIDLEVRDAFRNPHPPCWVRVTNPLICSHLDLTKLLTWFLKLVSCESSRLQCAPQGHLAHLIFPISRSLLVTITAKLKPAVRRAGPHLSHSHCPIPQRFHLQDRLVHFPLSQSAYARSYYSN